jgi:hypothetical protein
MLASVMFLEVSVMIDDRIKTTRRLVKIKNREEYLSVLDLISIYKSKLSYTYEKLKKEHNQVKRKSYTLKCIFEVLSDVKYYYSLKNNEKNELFILLLDADFDELELRVNSITQLIKNQINTGIDNLNSVINKDDYLNNINHKYTIKTPPSNIYNRIILKYTGSEIEATLFQTLKNKPLFIVKHNIPNNTDSLYYVLTTIEDTEDNRALLNNHIKNNNLNVTVIEEDYPIMYNNQLLKITKDYELNYSDTTLKIINNNEYRKLSYLNKLINKKYEPLLLSDSVFSNDFNLLAENFKNKIGFDFDSRKAIKEVNKEYSSKLSKTTTIDIYNHIYNDKICSLKFKDFSNVFAIDIDNKEKDNNINSKTVLSEIENVLGKATYTEYSNSKTSKGIHAYFIFDSLITNNQKDELLNHLNKTIYNKYSKNTGIDLHTKSLRLPLSDSYSNDKSKDIITFRESFNNPNLLSIAEILINITKLVKVEEIIEVSKTVVKKAKMTKSNNKIQSQSIKSIYISEGARYHNLWTLCCIYKSFGYSQFEGTQLIENHIIGKSKDIEANKQKYFYDVIDSIWDKIEIRDYSSGATNYEYERGSFISNLYDFNFIEQTKIKSSFEKVINKGFKRDCNKARIMNDLYIVYCEIYGKQKYIKDNEFYYNDSKLKDLNGSTPLSLEYITMIKNHYNLQTDVKVIMKLLKQSEIIAEQFITLPNTRTRTSYNYKVNHFFDYTFCKHYIVNHIDNVIILVNSINTSITSFISNICSEVQNASFTDDLFNNQEIEEIEYGLAFR